MSAPPGRGIALAEALDAGCTCGAELRAVDPFGTFIENALVKLLTDSDREAVESIVELHCLDCGFVGCAQR